MRKLIEQTIRHEVNWDMIEWNNHQNHVIRIQERIFRATRNGEWEKVKNLQKLLVRSHSARLIAVKKVTQENKGKYTAGIDGLVYINSIQRQKLVEEIECINLNCYKCQPVKRVYIPKANGKSRPLGIPTIKDRVLQLIVKMALEPEWESKFEPNSYGFRPGRRCQDAIQQIRDCIRDRSGRNSSEWILDADITGCFDNINHEMLLKKLPVFTQTIRNWLKAGVMEFGTTNPTKTGTPQGGIISPLLANIALDGMERQFGMENRKGKYRPPSIRTGKNHGISLVRYADDFVVVAPSQSIIYEYVLPKMNQFLAERGMVLNMEKTQIIHRTAGIDFLRFTIQQHLGSPKPTCLTRPSKKAVHKHLLAIKNYLDRNKQATAEEIINKLNPIILGWGTYYRYSNAKESFSFVDYRIWQMLWHWCVRRHPNKGKLWICNKYFKTINGRKWIFATSQTKRLIFTASIPVISMKYAKIKGTNSPFDSNLHEYWKKRARGNLRNMEWD